MEPAETKEGKPAEQEVQQGRRDDPRAARRSGGVQVQVHDVQGPAERAGGRLLAKDERRPAERGSDAEAAALVCGKNAERRGGRGVPGDRPRRDQRQGGEGRAGGPQGQGGRRPRGRHPEGADARDDQGPLRLYRQAGEAFHGEALGQAHGLGHEGPDRVHLLLPDEADGNQERGAHLLDQGV